MGVRYSIIAGVPYDSGLYNLGHICIQLIDFPSLF